MSFQYDSQITKQTASFRVWTTKESLPYIRWLCHNCIFSCKYYILSVNEFVKRNLLKRLFKIHWQPSLLFLFWKKKAITAALTYRFPSKSPNKKVCHLWRYNFELLFKSAVSSFNGVAWGRAQFSTGNQLGLLYHSGVVASYKEGLIGGSRGPPRSL